MRVQWVQEGMPDQRMPVIWSRPSRLIPHSVNHWLVGWYESDSAMLVEIRSFVPHDHRPLRWWQLWRAFAFHGEVVHGDRPD